MNVASLGQHNDEMGCIPNAAKHSSAHSVFNLTCCRCFLTDILHYFQLSVAEAICGLRLFAVMLANLSEVSVFFTPLENASR